MSVRGHGNALPLIQEEDPLLTMADVEALAERLGLIVITDGNRFEYSRPGLVPPGWRRFCMAQRARPLKPTEPQ